MSAQPGAGEYGPLPSVVIPQPPSLIAPPPGVGTLVPETIMPAAVVNQSDGDESSSAFAAMVTQDGNLAELQLLGDQAGNKSLFTQKQLELAAASTASFQPASKDGDPVPLNVIWIVTHRTVRGTFQRARVEVTSTFRIG